MKITRLRVVALALVAAVTTFVGMGPAAAQDVVVRVGGRPPGPPPGYVEHRWGRPGPGAIWFPGHREWRGGGWVWIGGYYGYPPRPGLVWVPGHWRHGYWHSGHWR